MPFAQPAGQAESPAHDTLLGRFLANWTTSLKAHALPLGGRSLRRDDLAAVDIGRPALGGNVATLLSPLFLAEVDEVFAALDAFFEFAGEARSGTVFLFSPWPTPDLRPRSWMWVGQQPLMLRPAGGSAPPAPAGLRIAEVQDEESLRAFEQAMVRGFEADDLAEQGPGALFSPDILRDARSRLWVGWQEDRPVSAASAFVDAGVVNVSLVGTVPEARRRGYGAALTWQATLADPALPALLLATDEGRPVYETMGYLPLFHFSVWSRERQRSSERFSGDP